jgi:hypothetical protein
MKHLIILLIPTILSPIHSEIILEFLTDYYNMRNLEVMVQENPKKFLIKIIGDKDYHPFKFHDKLIANVQKQCPAFQIGGDIKYKLDLTYESNLSSQCQQHLGYGRVDGFYQLFPLHNFVSLCCYKKFKYYIEKEKGLKTPTGNILNY